MPKRIEIQKILPLWRYIIPIGSVILLLIVIWISQTGSSNTPRNRLDFLFRSGDNCAAPCWRDIRSGQSTKKDVQRLMAVFEGDQTAEDIGCQSSKNDLERCIWRDRRAQFRVVIDLTKGLVQHLRFTSTAGFVAASYTVGKPFPTTTPDPEWPNYNPGDVPLKDLFDYLGEPDEYSARVSPGQHGDDSLQLILFYREGILLERHYSHFATSGFMPGCKIDVDLDLPITNIYFTPFTDLEQIINGQNEMALFSTGDKAAVWTGAKGLPLTTCGIWPNSK